MQIIKGKQPKPLKAVIYGPEGVGKSTLASQFPNPLFLDVEGGTSRLDVARTPRPTSWAHLKQIIGEIVKDQMGFQTLVIDTADWAEKLAIRQVCAEKGYSGLGGNGDYGASYNQLAQMWSDLLTQLDADLIETCKMQVVFLAHSATRKFELPEEAGQFDRYQLALEKKVAPLLKEWSDTILFINYKTIVVVDEKTKTAKGQGGTRRVMFAEHQAAFDAKNRDGLPREMDLGIAPLAGCFIPLGVAAPPNPVAAPPNPPQQQPAAPPNPAPAPAAAPALTGQHRSLIQMMQTAGVTYEQVNWALAERGRYPLGTPIENIDPSFIDAWICKHWDKLLEMIKAHTDNASAAAQKARTHEHRTRL